MLIRLELYSGMAIKEAHYEECFDGEKAGELFKEFVEKLKKEKEKERPPKR